MTPEGTLAQLIQSQSADTGTFTEFFLDSMEDIFRFGMKDVNQALMSVDIDQLIELHKRLCGKMKEFFPQLKDSRTVNRQMKHTLSPDIFIMGMSLVNGCIAKDVDKIFTPCPSPAGSSTITAADEFRELILTVTTLTQRINALEKEVRDLKQTNAALVDQGGTSNAPPPSPGASPLSPSTLPPPPPDTADPAVETTRDGAADTDNITLHGTPPVGPEVPNPIIGTAGSDNNSLQIPLLEGPSQAPSDHRESVLLSAAAATHAKTTSKTLYVGNVHEKHSDDDIKAFFVLKGLPEPTQIRLLRHNRGQRSFKVLISPQGFAKALEPNLWPSGIRVRPFLDSPPAGGQQGLLPKPSHKNKNKNKQPRDDSMPPGPYQNPYPWTSGRDAPQIHQFSGPQRYPDRRWNQPSHGRRPAWRAASPHEWNDEWYDRHDEWTENPGQWSQWETYDDLY